MSHRSVLRVVRQVVHPARPARACLRVRRAFSSSSNASSFDPSSAPDLERIKSRIRNKSLHKYICEPASLMSHITDGTRMGWSGFTQTGCPKTMPKAIAEHFAQVAPHNRPSLELICGASASESVEGPFANLGMLSKRYAFQNNSQTRGSINTGKTHFVDVHLGDVANGIETGGVFPTGQNGIDLAIIEATGIDNDGYLVLGCSVGASSAILHQAKKIIIEVNTKIPNLWGFHDIHEYRTRPAPAYSINAVHERVGRFTQPFDHSKIIGIVEAHEWDDTPQSMAPIPDFTKDIAKHIIRFFQEEVAAGRMPKELGPLQSGIGSIADAVLFGLLDTDFERMTVWTEVLQEGFLALLDTGKVTHASASSIRLTQDGFRTFFDGLEDYKGRITLRGQGLSNFGDLIRRLGVIAMNTPVEFDIYGHVNSTCAGGTRMVNGIGGSNDFWRNGAISIAHAPSTRPTKSDEFGISTIVPMVAHVDSTEHDMDVFVTEQGLADCRGLSPRQRSRLIIDKCVHPEFKEQILRYVMEAEDACKGRSMHQPHILRHVYDMHSNLHDNGTMRIPDWNLANVVPSNMSQYNKGM